MYTLSTWDLFFWKLGPKFSVVFTSRFTCEKSCTEHTGCWIVYLVQAMVLQHWMAGWEMHHQKTNVIIHCRSVLLQTAKGTLVWHYDPCLLPTRLMGMCQAWKTHPVFKCSEKGWDRNHEWTANRRLRENINVPSKDKRNAGFLCFQGHLTQKVKTPTCNLNTDLLLIPGGMTSLLHVLLMWYLTNHSERSNDHTRRNYHSVTCSLCGS